MASSNGPFSTVVGGKVTNLQDTKGELFRKETQVKDGELNHGR
jgi:hypothetical protein